VENGVNPSPESQFSLAYIGFSEPGKQSQEVYDRFTQALCDPQDAHIRNAFTETSDLMWCSKVRGGSYCYVSYTLDSSRSDWDWMIDPANQRVPSEMTAHTKVREVCDIYDGQLISTLERNLLKNSYAFKPTTCKIRIYAEDNKPKTTQYCFSHSGTADNNICTIISAADEEACTNDNNVADGYFCIERDKCLASGGAFEKEEDEYYCTDPTGIRKTDIFNSYTDTCIVSGEVAVCNLQAYTIDETIVTEYLLKETTE